MNPYALAGIEVTPEQIISEWEKHFRMKLHEIVFKDRHEDIYLPRHILCYSLYTYGSVSMEWIAGCIHRTRTTVLNSINICKNQIDSKKEGKVIQPFIMKLADLSGDPDPKFTIDVKLNREDLRILLPDIEGWQIEHWSLKALWNLFQERKYTGKAVKKPAQHRGITGKSTLTSVW